MTIFKLPDLGEGLQEAEIVKWHVKVGDFVKVDQPLVAVETAKAIVEVPSPIEGTVVKLFGDKGDSIDVGASLVEFEVKEKNLIITRKNKTENSLDLESNLDTKDLKNDDNTDQKGSRRDTGTVAGIIKETNEILDEKILNIGKTAAKTKVPFKVAPAIRMLAKRLNVNLENVTPTGVKNTITKKDVEACANLLDENKKNKIDAIKVELQPGFEYLKGSKKTMAQMMRHSHKEVAPASVWDDAILINWPEKEDITVRLILAIVAGCKAEPGLNSHFDASNLSKKVIKEINLGIAVDTEEGLFVPVMRDVANKSAKELRAELDQIKIQVKNRSIPKESFQDATFTLSNFGKFSGRYASSIIVPPQVAILGVGSIRKETVVIDDEIKISKVLPLSLTIDHRVLTGGEATRFLAKVIESLK